MDTTSYYKPLVFTYYSLISQQQYQTMKQQLLSFHYCMMATNTGPGIVIATRNNVYVVKVIFAFYFIYYTCYDRRRYDDVQFLSLIHF